MRMRPESSSDCYPYIYIILQTPVEYIGVYHEDIICIYIILQTPLEYIGVYHEDIICICIILQTPLEYIGVYHEDIMCPRVPAKVVAATDTVDRILTTGKLFLLAQFNHFSNILSFL